MHGDKKKKLLCIFICIAIYMGMYMDMMGDNKEIFNIIAVHVYARQLHQI